MTFDSWTIDQLWDELWRIDAMRLPISGATMMRRNAIWLALAERGEMAA